jgi:hypothetical protein
MSEFQLIAATLDVRHCKPVCIQVQATCTVSVFSKHASLFEILLFDRIEDRWLEKSWVQDSGQLAPFLSLSTGAYVRRKRNEIYTQDWMKLEKTVGKLGRNHTDS